MSPLLGLLLLLALFPALLIVVAVHQLRHRGRTSRMPIEGVVQEAPSDYHQRWMTVAYTGPDGREIVGRSNEGFTGAKAGDPITVWVDPDNPRRFSICAPSTGGGMAFMAIGTAIVTLILFYRFLVLG